MDEKKKNRNKRAYKNFDREGLQKLTWKTFYKDFKIFNPDLVPEVHRWEPYDYFNILLYFKNGRKGLYNIDTHNVKMLSPNDIAIAAKGW